jgi:DNA-binding NtrC family response regulator
MIIVNAGAIPEGLIESELFGAEKGAYTGAVAKTTGYFEAADKGTIFLDEVGEMPMPAQVRLLRVLESGEFSRVGSSRSQFTDVRVIAATNKDLGKEVQEKRFREDLYYRLSTVQIEIPPLRDRTEDILPIYNHFQHRFAQQYNARPKRLDLDSEQLLVNYYWPGNVRELRNVAEQSVVLVPGDAITVDNIRPLLRGVGTSASRSLVLAGEGRDDRFDDLRDRELLYRLLIELRLELRELKDWVQRSPQAVVPSSPQTDSVSRSLPVVRSDPPAFANDRPDRDISADRDEQWVIEEAPFEIQNEAKEAGQTAYFDSERPLPSLSEIERELIVEALKRYNGNRRKSAERLGISERTLYRKLKEYELISD